MRVIVPMGLVREAVVVEEPGVVVAAEPAAEEPVQPVEAEAPDRVAVSHGNHAQQSPRRHNVKRQNETALASCNQQNPLSKA